MLTIPSEIRNLLKSDSVNKNFRVHFPNGERADITNDNIVDESITFGESICSSEQLQFGLCETPTLEFETVGVENIKGAVIECSMEVIVPESLSSVTGVTYKSDINKWVYSLPYGTFIVDSCKKQSDMTHRRITTYNTFGYKNWEFSNLTKDIFRKGFYWYNNNLKMSIEGLIKLILPNKNSNFEEATVYATDVNSIWSRVVTDINRTETWELYAYWNIFTYLYGYHSIHYFKTYYDENFINKISEIKELLTSLGCDNFNDMCAWLKDNVMIYNLRLDKTTSPYYTLLMPHSLRSDNNIYVPELVNPFKISNINTFIFTSFDKSEDQPSDHSLTWSNDGFHKNSTGPFRATFIGFTRLELKHKIVVDSRVTVDETLYDTGTYVPHIYIDSNISNIDIFNSPSNVYIPIPIQKKSVKMEKAGTENTVTKNLYKYDLSSFIDYDPKEIIQSYLELQGKFGLVKRDGSIDFISVNEAFNTPDETIPKSEYETIWYDDYMSKPYGRISATYTNENNESTYTYLDIVEDFSEEKYKTYDISNNFFIKNYSRTEEDIQLIFTAMSLNMKDISFMPMQITMKGRPDLEAGDVILIESDDQEEPIVGFMMQRRLTGVESLRDEISSQDEISSETASSLKATYDEDTGTLTLYTADTRR